MQTLLESQLDLFHGAATARLARLYARMPSVPGATLVGHLRGPHSLLGSTLPATIPFRDLGTSPSLLAEAILPDPCFWSPEMPALYTAHIELRHGSEVLASVERTIGVKAFGTRGRFFYDQGKRTVLRGASWQWPLSPELLDWHDHAAVVLAVNPNDALCDEASRVGVRVVAKLQQPDHEIAQEVRRLGRHAAVQVIAIDANGAPLPVGIDRELQQLAPNTVFARTHQLGPTSAVAADQAAAHFVFTAHNQPTPEYLLALPGAVLLWEGGGEYPNVELARAAADRVQAKFAPLADFAGYFV